MSKLITNGATLGGARAKSLSTVIIALSIAWCCSVAAQEPPDSAESAETATGRPVQQSPMDALKAELEALRAAAEEAEKVQSRQVAPREQPVSIYQQQRDFRAAQQEARLQQQREAAEAAAKKALGPENVDSAGGVQAMQGTVLARNLDAPQAPASQQQLAVARAPAPAVQPDALPGALATIAISFQPDGRRAPKSTPVGAWTPRISGDLNDGFTVLARAEGHDAAGRVVNIDPDWVPADPSTVTIAPAKGQTVRITVRGAGASNLTVAAAGISKDLLISAAPDRQNSMRVEILQ